MFAQTNADVATLNAHARELHKARGDLGEDHTLKTATGEQQFATGDRIQFTGNGRTKDEKRAGLVNGRVGTIAGIEILDDGKPRVTVTLDHAHRREAAAGEFHRRRGRPRRRVREIQARIRRHDLSRAGPHARRGLCRALGAMAEVRLLRRADAAPRSRPHFRRA